MSTPSPLPPPRSSPSRLPNRQHTRPNPPLTASPPRRCARSYEPDLWVQHLSDSHTLLLNKFNLVAHHVLVVTRQFESQQVRRHLGLPACQPPALRGGQADRAVQLSWLVRPLARPLARRTR